MRTDNPEGAAGRRLAIRRRAGRSGRRGAGDSRGRRGGNRRAGRDVAIFYRINSLSREFETALARHRIPYQLAGGFAFYDRAEVKDVLAYLRLVANPQDRPAFLARRQRARAGHR